jgi:hypothetical protein
VRLLVLVGVLLWSKSDDSKRSDESLPPGLVVGAAVGSEPGVLPPDAFSEIPPEVYAAMVSQRCRVPQAFFPKSPNNVISGAFAAADQRDWAFLCSKNGRSTIHIVWGGPARCAPTLAEGSDRTYFQQTEGGQFEYSRSLATASPALIRQRYSDHRYGPAP